jgi:hypothetical protein
LGCVAVVVFRRVVNDDQRAFEHREQRVDSIAQEFGRLCRLSQIATGKSHERIDADDVWAMFFKKRAKHSMNETNASPFLLTSYDQVLTTQAFFFL